MGFIAHHRTCTVLVGSLLILASFCAIGQAVDPASKVNPLIGSSHGGDIYPGAVMPFGMLQWSPENTRGKHTRTASPSCYLYDSARIRCFALTHISGAGCAYLKRMHLADYAWLSASRAWSGSREFGDWNIRQGMRSGVLSFEHDINEARDDYGGFTVSARYSSL